MSFHEVRFPSAISFGSTGGPRRRTEIVTLRNGFEERNAAWAHSRRRYDAGLGVRTTDDLSDIVAFFEGRLGQLYGFRWKDWADFKSARPSEAITALDQKIGDGTGVATEFPLVKAYVSGPETYLRPIAKPVHGTLKVAVDGTELVEGLAYSADYTKGLVTLFTAPGPEAEITAGYEFDVPVRFDADRIETSAAAFEAGDIPSVPVVEVRV